MIECISYNCVNGLRFGATVEEAIDIFGEPNRKYINQDKTVDLVYDEFRVVFNDNQKFSEFGLYPQTKAKINGVEIPWYFKSIKNIIKLDSDPRIDDVGFIILYELGMTIVDFHTSDDDDFSDKAFGFFSKGIFDDSYDETQPLDFEKIEQKIRIEGLEVEL
jgi:hypothetical protein